MHPKGIPVLACCNEYYAPGLAVALRSLVSNAARDAKFRIIVIDGGMRDSSWHKIEATVIEARPGTEITRARPSLARFDSLITDYGASYMTYARLLVDELFDDPRVLYVDSDILFQRDIVPLFETDLRGMTVAACQDPLVGTIGNERMDCKALGLNPSKPYFNAGLLLIDLTRWRDERVSERTLKYLSANGERCPYWDQSALNVTLYDRWHFTDSVWNQFHVLIDNPRFFIDIADSNLHFVGPAKPWQFGQGNVPGGTAFHSELARTQFADHRPSRLDRVLSQTVDWFESAEDHGDRVLFHGTPRWVGMSDDDVRTDMYELWGLLRGNGIELAGLRVVRVVDDKLEELVVVDF
jgi:lipopolysaccharide biosynthesis glycosyltransferase